MLSFLMFIRKELVAAFVFFGQICSVFVWPAFAFAQTSQDKAIFVPAFLPESMSLTGMKLDLSNPLEIKFYLNPPSQVSVQNLSRDRMKRQIEYFLTALTVPETHQWVNLSPLEEGRIIPEDFGQTDMGQALLEQDRHLKLLSAFLLNPASSTGKKFWGVLNDRLRQEYGTTDIAMDIAHRVWLVPQRAVFYTQGPEVYLADAHMKVLLDRDYLSEKSGLVSGTESRVREIFCDVLREVVIPRIEREVNGGAGFVELRRIYQAMALAAWYKRAVRNGDLALRYAERGRLLGVSAEDPFLPEKIFQRYVKNFSGGAVNLVYESYDVLTGDVLPRKYFSGGWSPDGWPQALAASAVAPGFLSVQVEVDASMQPDNEGVYTEVLRSFRSIDGPQELSIDLEEIQRPSVTVWLRRSLWTRTMRLFQEHKLSVIRRMEKELTLQMASRQWRAVAQMIARPGKKSDIYRNEMTAAILAVDVRKMNFWTIFQGLLTARLRVEWLERRWDASFARKIREFGLNSFRAQWRSACSSVYINGPYKDLYRRVHLLFAEKGYSLFLQGEPSSLFSVGTFASRLSDVFSPDQLSAFLDSGELQEVPGREHDGGYMSTEKTSKGLLRTLYDKKEFFAFHQETLLEGAGIEQLIIRDYTEEAYHILYAGRTRDMPALIKGIVEIWERLFDDGRSREERVRDFADFEWLFYQVNPLMRGGAALGTAYSVIARMALGISLPEVFVAQDQIALSMTRQDYVDQRYRELIRMDDKADALGGIDMNASFLEGDVSFSKGAVYFHQSRSFLGRLDGLRPVIVAVK